MARNLKTMTGSAQADWTDTATLDPVSEWANEILGEGLHKAVIYPLTKQRRGNKKTLFLQSSRQDSTWATGVTDARASGETALDYETTYVDPVETHTIMQVAYETLDEVDIVNLEADIRDTLAYDASRKVTDVVYTSFDDAALSSGDWQVAGSALEYCNANTAVDWGTELTTDLVKSAAETLVAALYPPDTCVLPPALYADLMHESQFMNAAQWGGQNTAITSRALPHFYGMDFYEDTDMPDDSAGADVGFEFNKDYYLGTVVSKDAIIAKYDHYKTNEWDFNLTIKLGAKVLREAAGIAFYT